MTNKLTNMRFMRSAMMIAFLATSVASRVALAVDEVEPNDSATEPQQLVIGGDGTIEVAGGILNTSSPVHRDVDFYSFHAQKDDVVTINIDGGMDANFVGVWTVLAVFGPDGTNPMPLRQMAVGDPVDSPGSASPFDARIDNFLVPQTGTYVVGVSSEPNEFVDINTLTSGSITSWSPYYNVNGSYRLIISGVTSTPSVPSVQQVSIEIRPGRRDVVWAHSTMDRDIKRGHDFRRGRGSEQSYDSERRHDLEALRGHFRGGVPVALLSSDTFNAPDVDQTKLHFGVTGNEDSLIRCHRHGIDVNRDGLPDVICIFDFRKANFEPGDNEGIVTGTTISGDSFEGRGWLKIVTDRRDQHGHRDRDRDRHRHRYHH